jgi:glycosyltransferase involved in cell wall biosynthesis
LGKPIVATDTPYGPREFLGNNEYGRIVPMKSPEALYHVLRLFLKGKVYARYQRQIQIRIHQYSETGMIRHYLSLVGGLYS